MNNENKIYIYNKSIDDLYSELSTSKKGLSFDDASNRLKTCGYNKLHEDKKKSNLLLFLSQFYDVMIVLLIFAALFSVVVSYYRHEFYTDSLIIISIVIINAFLSFIQEKKLIWR